MSISGLVAVALVGTPGAMIRCPWLPSGSVTIIKITQNG
jgi:hypothetical protein